MDKHELDNDRDCRPCDRYKEMPDPGIQSRADPDADCPTTLKEMCEQVNAKFDEWREWGENTNDTLIKLAKFIWRIEHAICCLEGHVIYGHARPRNGLICDGKGHFQEGTLHEFVIETWPITDPPKKPWGE